VRVVGRDELTLVVVRPNEAGRPESPPAPS